VDSVIGRVYQPAFSQNAVWFQVEGIPVGDGIYTQNIQIVELNALNAAFAVIKWKKIAGIYEDVDREHHSTYPTNFHLLTSEEKPV